jgi:four helix bundle protein
VKQLFWIPIGDLKAQYSNEPEKGMLIVDPVEVAGTSVGAKYRAAARARSRADFIAKLGIVEEECDETVYWMEVIVALRLLKRTRLAELLAEGNELTAIVVSSINTARRRPRH